MEFKKCERCGSFFISPDNICGNCHSKENAELSTLKNYMSNYDGEQPSISTLVEETGIPEKNIYKYLQTNNFGYEPKISL